MKIIVYGMWDGKSDINEWMEQFYSRLAFEKWCEHQTSREINKIRKALQSVERYEDCAICRDVINNKHIKHAEKIRREKD